MRERGAEYTLQDHDSPDLRAVIADIADERQGRRRRERAGALLAALGRAWDSRLSEFAQVDAAATNYRWVPKGKIPAFWLAQAGNVAWLDDERGTPRRPAELRVRTPGSEAIHGIDSPDYLHADLDQPIRHAVLTALGVSSDPSRSEMVGRLRELQSASYEDEVSHGDQRRESELVYRALARSLRNEPTDSDLTTEQLRVEFGRGSLLLTNVGWLSPRSVLLGPPIFGDLRAFPPPITECEPLWRTLRLRQPSPSDCLDVLRQVATRRSHAPDATEEAILLETLRALSEDPAREDTIERRKLARLPLWTSQGWLRDRPVFATDDPVLAHGLSDRLPIWQPGGGLDQFRPLLEPLRIAEIQAAEAIVIKPELAQRDRDLTELFRRALELLRDDLQRNDAQLAEDLTVPWTSLATYVVRVHPSLALAVSVDSGQEYDCDVNAKVDTSLGALFVTGPAVLARVGRGRESARSTIQEWSAARCASVASRVRPSRGGDRSTSPRTRPRTR